METKRVCPHCGETLHEKPYLMASRSDGERVWTPQARQAAILVLLFLFLVGALVIARHAGAPI